MSPSVCAVVVTAGRPRVLQRALTAVAAQTRTVDRTLVVDSAGDGDTAALLAAAFPDVHALSLAADDGHAGGFHAGMKRAYDDGFDWLWLLHDDAVPAESALEELLVATTAVASLPEPRVVASKVLSLSGELHRDDNGAPDLIRIPHAALGVEHSLMPIRYAGFVSLLVGRKAIRDYGLPLRPYFACRDDVEFTARVLRRETGYLATKSVVRHGRGDGSSPCTGALGLHRYVRNTVLMLRGSAWGKREKVLLVLDIVRAARTGLDDGGTRASRVVPVLRGLAAGLRQAAV